MSHVLASHSGCPQASCGASSIGIRPPPYAGQWVVADMDGTLTSTPSKAHGHYLPLSTSPCKPVLVRFLRGGGSLCVVSTAGRRMWTQLYQELRHILEPAAGNAVSSPNLPPTQPPQARPPPPLCPGRLVLCAFSGAALFASNAATGAMVEDVEYRMTGLNGKPTVLPEEHFDSILGIMRAALLRSFERVHRDPSYLRLLSRKYHAPLKELMAAAIGEGGEDHWMDTDMLSLGPLRQHGRYLKETHDALLDVQYVPEASAVDDGSLESPDDGPASAAAQITALGVPIAHAHEIFPPDLIAKLHDKFSVQVKFQPNSVVVTRSGLDKGTCVARLEQAYGLVRTHAVAFGDIPESIDRPLMLYPPMPFVSVSLTPDRDPPEVTYRVGGEEHGTAAVLTALLDALDAVAGEPVGAGSPEVLGAAVRAATAAVSSL